MGLCLHIIKLNKNIELNIDNLVAYLQLITSGIDTKNVNQLKILFIVIK